MEFAMIIAAISMMSVTTFTLATFVWGLRKEEAQLCIVGGLTHNAHKFLACMVIVVLKIIN